MTCYAYLLSGVAGGLLVLVLGTALIATDVVDVGDTKTVVRQTAIPQPTAPAKAGGKTVADIYRDWLRQQGKTGNRLVISAGRLLDPWQTIRTGLVPYWCETSTRAGVAAAELWLVGSPPFTSVDILPEPPGATWSQVAPKKLAAELLASA